MSLSLKSLEKKRKYNLEFMRAWRLANPEKKREKSKIYNRKNPQKVKAYNKLHRYIKLGVISSPTIYQCSDCNNQATYYDHHDYLMPLYVFPVCNGCNRKRGSAINWNLIPEKK